MVDDDGVRGQEEVGEALRDLRELKPRTVKNLQTIQRRQAQTRMVNIKINVNDLSNFYFYLKFYFYFF